MAESEMPFYEVSGDTDSSELDCSLDLFFEEEEGPAIPEGPSDNNIPVRAYRYEPYLDADAIPPTPASPPGGGDEPVSDRLQNTDWCSFGHCVTQPTDYECVCCKEQEKVVDMIDSQPDVCCITST